MERQKRMNLLYRVARMSYIDGTSNAKIAGILKQSPTHVANLLKEAIDEKIVTIDVRIPISHKLGDLVAHKLGLREAIVIPHDPDCDALLRQLGDTAAEYFDRSVKTRSSVAIGGGYLMFEMIQHLKKANTGIQIFPAAIIGRGPVINHIDPITLVTMLWTRCGREKGHAHYVTVTPPDTDDREKIRQHYLELQGTRRVRSLINDMQNVDSVFLSIGGLEADPEYVKVTRYASENLVTELGISKEEMIREGAVGDIGYAFYDENGNGRDEWNIGIPLGLKQLKKMAASPDKQVVVVAGSYKIDALLALLRKKHCNVLITDSVAAEQILEKL